jgi:hypothetical protein
MLHSPILPKAKQEELITKARKKKKDTKEKAQNVASP